MTLDDLDPRLYRILTACREAEQKRVNVWNAVKAAVPGVTESEIYAAGCIRHGQVRDGWLLALLAAPGLRARERLVGAYVALQIKLVLHEMPSADFNLRTAAGQLGMSLTKVIDAIDRLYRLGWLVPARFDAETMTMGLDLLAPPTRRPSNAQPPPDRSEVVYYLVEPALVRKRAEFVLQAPAPLTDNARNFLRGRIDEAIAGERSETWVSLSWLQMQWLLGLMERAHAAQNVASNPPNST